MSKFQIIFIAIFVIFIVAGVIAFATFKTNQTTTLPTITIWGTLPAESFNKTINEYNITVPERLQVVYVEKKEQDFDNEYVQALARGQGPDAILVPLELINKESDKIFIIPYETLPERSFKDVFIQEGEMLLRPNGILGLPFAVDPLVMYWNRDIFANEGFATYPRTWSEFANLGTRITKKDSNANIMRSAVALGEYRNLTHAKEVLTALFIQAGDPITVRTTNGVNVTLGLEDNNRYSPAESALTFFTNFANPSRPEYSWNRSLPQSKNAFIGETLATYFGFSSEAKDIRAKNPNLNFDSAPFPQIANSNSKSTYGKLYAIAIAKSTQNAGSTYTVIAKLVSAPVLSFWTKFTSLPPVRRDLLSTTPSDPYLATAYLSALLSKTWIDPNTAETHRILQNLVESVTTSRETPRAALSTSRNELLNLFNTNQ